VQKDIQPKYFDKANVQCSCGNHFTVGSTKEFIETEVCSNCHPFYTKKEKIMDTMGQVQKFKDKLSKKSTSAKRVKNPRERKAKK
jgi:large subunit ribosomal protein L31